MCYACLLFVSSHYAKLRTEHHKDYLTPNSHVISRAAGLVYSKSIECRNKLFIFVLPVLFSRILVCVTSLFSDENAAFNFFSLSTTQEILSDLWQSNCLDNYLGQQ